MFVLIPLAAVILAAATAPAAKPADADLQAYRAAASGVGRDAEANLKLALWCEAHGLEAERTRHLAMVVVADPANATARGLLGLVRDGEKWRRPDAVADRVRQDAALSNTLAEYNTLRAKTPNTADGQMKLARWCKQHDLKAEQNAHLINVVRLDPSRETVWKSLGYKRHHGLWMTSEQIASVTAESIAQHAANGKWRPKFAQWKEELRQASTSRQAEDGLATVTDPRAVPSVWRVFTAGNAADRVRAVQLFGQIEGQRATQALTCLAVFAPESECRRAAAESLVRRDPREAIGPLINFLATPVKYEFKPSTGPGEAGELLVEGEKFNVRRDYRPPELPPDLFTVMDQEARGIYTPNFIDGLAGVGNLPLRGLGVTNPNSRSGVFLNGVSVDALRYRRRLLIQNDLAQARQAVVSANQQIAGDVALVESQNKSIHSCNDAVLTALQPLTGQDFGEDRLAWQAWWTDQQGYAQSRSQPSEPKPTITQNVSLAFTPTYTTQHHACFARGTLVQTFDGRKAIESIQVGDRVLSQDAITGALDYQPILHVFHNPPASTVSVNLGSETIVATGIHRFWKAGKGWAMARDLKPGDLVRTVRGTSRVESVSPSPTQPVFNLEVADGHSFFVGKTSALVHDNSLVQPVSDPFDAPADLAAVDGK